MPVREVWIAKEEPKEIREVWEAEPSPMKLAVAESKISPLAQLEYEGLPLDPEARRKEELRRTAMGETAVAPAVFPLPLPIPGMIGGIGPPAPELTMKAIKEGAIAQVGGATARQVLEESIPEFGRAVAEGYLPTAIGQTGKALGLGVLGFADRVMSQVGEIIQQFARRGEVDLSVVQAIGEAKQALWHYEPTDPAAQLAVKFVSAIPLGAKTAFHVLADEFKNSPNIEAGLRTAGDMAEIAAFGKVFKTLGVPLKAKEAVRVPGLKEVRAADRVIKRDLKRERRLEEAARIEEAVRVKAKPKPKIREAEIGEEVVTVEEALAERERVTTVKALVKEKEAPVADSSRVLVEWDEVNRLTEEARVAREVEPRVTPIEPTASFLGWQETIKGDHIALYNIESGPKKGTTVTVEGLKREGIKVPEAVEKPTKVTPPTKPTITLSELNESPGLYKSILDNRKFHTKEVITRAEEIGAHVLAEIKQEGEIVRRYKKKESTKSIAQRYKLPEDEVISILDEAEALGKIKPLTLEVVRDRYRRELAKVEKMKLSPEDARPLVILAHEKLADTLSDRTRFRPTSDAEGMEIASFLNDMRERIEPVRRTAADVDASEAQAREVARTADEIRGAPDVTLEFGGFEGFGKMYRDLANSLKRRSVETKKPLSPEAREVLDHGEIVKHNKIKGMYRPPIFRTELEILKGLKKLDQVLTHRAFENPIRTFEEAGGEALLDMTIHPYHAREFAIVKMGKAAKKSLRELRSEVGPRSRRRIMIYAVSKQKRGMDLLKHRGIKEIPELTPKEMEVYNVLRERYKSWYVRLNRVRKAIGKEPFPEEKDYFTFIRTLSTMEELGFKPMHTRVATFASQYVKAGATAFRFAKRRVGGKYKLKLDPFEVLETYESQAIRHIQLSPLIAKLRELQTAIVDPKTKATFLLRNNNPVFAISLHSWTNHIAGLKSAGFELPPFFEKAMLRINSNLTAAILGANLRSAMIQVSALRNTVAEVGFGYTLRGIGSLINPRARNLAMKKSKVLAGRRYDVTVEDALRAIRAGRLGELQRVGARAALKPLQILDIETAKACWHAAYKYGMEEMGYKAKRAITYADDVVTKTQASAMPGDIAPIQRAVAGRFLTLFQTFTINDWNFLIRDILGMRNATVNTPMAFAKAIRYIAATTLFNILFEDVLHIQSPFPTPIRAFREALERGDDTPSLAWNVAKEFIEPIPIVGAARYGKGPGGPGVELLNETIKYVTRKPMAKPAWEVGGKWLGLPGTAQVAKTVRAKKRGETPYGQAVGTYTPPEERAKPRRRGRGLRTRRGGMRGGL